MFLSFITFLINLGPIPAMFILDKPNFLLFLGIILLNILAIKSFLVLTWVSFLIIFNPQKVKNIVTSLPIALAPLAIIKEAIALSKSPLNIIKFLPSFIGAISSVDSFLDLLPFSIMATYLSSVFSALINVFPVFLHQDFISFINPGSVDITSSLSPSFNVFNFS